MIFYIEYVSKFHLYVPSVKKVQTTMKICYSSVLLLLISGTILQNGYPALGFSNDVISPEQILLGDLENNPFSAL